MGLSASPLNSLVCYCVIHCFLSPTTVYSMGLWVSPLQRLANFTVNDGILHNNHTHAESCSFPLTTIESVFEIKEMLVLANVLFV